MAEAETAHDAGSAALALVLFARQLVEASGDPSMTANLVDLGGGSLAILLEGEPAGLVAALDNLNAVLAKPEFLDALFPAAEWQSALRRLRIGAETRALEGKTGSEWRLGDTQGLFGTDIVGARSAWESGFSPGRTEVVLVADARRLAISSAFAATIAGSFPFSPVARPDLSEKASIAILSEYIGATDGRGVDPPWRLAAGGIALEGNADRAIAVPARSSGDTAMVPAGKAVHGIPAPKLAMAKARALYRLFGADPGDEAAVAMSLDLDSGGDGSLPFLLDSSIESMGADSLVSAASSLGLVLR